MSDVKKFNLFVLFLLAIFAAIIVAGCSTYTVHTDRGWMGPDTYYLEGSGDTIWYYNGDCCCVAETALDTLAARMNRGEWTMREAKHAPTLLRMICKEVGGTPR